MRALLPLTLLLAGLLCSAAVMAGEEEDLASSDLRWKRLKAAEKLIAAGNMKGLCRAVLAAGKRGNADDVEVLVSLALKEDNPLIRLLYGRGLEVAGAGAVPKLIDNVAKASAIGKMRGIEVLGFLRDESSIEALFTHTASADRGVATEAFRALARFLPRKQKNRLAEAAVAVPDDIAAQRGAWALVDVVRSPRAAAGALRKLARGKGPEVDRARALISDVSEEGLEQAFRYPKTHLVGVEKWFLKRKPTVVVEGDALAKSRLQKALDFMKEKAPGYHQLVTRAFDTIAARTAKEKIVWGTRTLVISPGVAGSSLWKPHQHATLMVRGAVQMLLRDCGDVHWWRRGFEQALKNVYWFAEYHSGFVTDETLSEYTDREIKRKPWR